jgi:hypothetical protein
MTKGAYAVAGVVALAAGYRGDAPASGTGSSCRRCGASRAVSVRVPVPVLLPDAQTPVR